MLPILDPQYTLHIKRQMLNYKRKVTQCALDFMLPHLDPQYTLHIKRQVFICKRKVTQCALDFMLPHLDPQYALHIKRQVYRMLVSPQHTLETGYMPHRYTHTHT